MSDKSIVFTAVGIILAPTVTWWLWWRTRPSLHFTDTALRFDDARNINKPGDSVIILRTYLMEWRTEPMVSNRGRMPTTLVDRAELHIEGRTITAEVTGEREFAPGACRRITLRFNDDARHDAPTTPTRYEYVLRDAHGKVYRFKGVYQA